MSTSVGFGRIISRDLTQHYDYQTRGYHHDISRTSSVKDLLGNVLYFGLRTALRVGALGLRVINAIVHIPVVICNFDLFKSKVKLAGLSAFRLLTPIAQIPLAIVGSLIKGLAPFESWQQKGVVLLRLSHEIDNYFDQLELDIAGEADEVEGSDFQMNLIFPTYVRDNGRIDGMRRSITGGHVRIVERLIRNGYSIDTVDRDGNSLLHLALMNRQEGVARRLIELDANFSLKNEAGNTPLHLAAEYGCIGIVQLLKEKGARRVQGIEGIVEKMPLFPAGAEHLVSEFFDYTTDSRNVRNLTPFDLATLCGRQQAANLLRED
ncbi:MAG: ankyrin repeat domain-containing protein [Simkaniaceae bacterium]|nr:MAG: ankyrin repeat domain-containing protein [Simkaniaceae bacterium]